MTATERSDDGTLLYAGNGKRHAVSEVIDYTNAHFSNPLPPASTSTSSGVTTIQPQQYAQANKSTLAANPFHYHPPRQLSLSRANSPQLYSAHSQLANNNAGSYHSTDLPSMYPESPASMYNRRLISSGSGMLTPGFPSALSALHPQHAKSILGSTAGGMNHLLAAHAADSSLTNSPSGHGLPALQNLVSSPATTGSNTPATSEGSAPAFIPWRLSPPSGTHSLQPLRSPPHPFAAMLSPLDRFVQQSQLNSSNTADATHSSLMASPMLPFTEHANGHHNSTANGHLVNGSTHSPSLDSKLLISPGVGKGSLPVPSPRQLNRSLLQSAIAANPFTQSPELAQLHQQRAAHLQYQRSTLR